MLDVTVTRSYCKVLQALLQEKNDATFWWQYFKFIACFIVTSRANLF